MGSRISHCQQTDAVHVAYYPNVPLRLQLLFAKGHPLTLTTRSDRRGHAVMWVQLHYVKVTGTVNISKLLIDGQSVIEAIDNHHLTSNSVGLWSTGTVLNVRSFKVIAL
jgi:hypothetical protein